MKTIDRLNQFVGVKELKPSEFEIACGISNGYFGNRVKLSGSMGSDILEKIAEVYTDLNMHWLITGKGNMLIKPDKIKAREDLKHYELQEEIVAYKLKDKMENFLKGSLEELNAIPGKKKKKV